MPEKALIRANDEFWRIRQWFSIRKEKNAYTGRFFAFNGVFAFFFAWRQKERTSARTSCVAIGLSSTSNREKIPRDQRQFLFLFPSYSHQRFTLLTEFSKCLLLNLNCFKKCWCINAFWSFYLTYEELKIRPTQKPADFSAGFIIVSTPGGQAFFLFDWA